MEEKSMYLEVAREVTKREIYTELQAGWKVCGGTGRHSRHR
jgi:hypothetical protein